VVRRRLLIHGRVQGVLFRDTLRRLAEQEDVAGWASNTWEGTVEAVLEGEEGAVDRLVAFAHEGPESAQVERVEVSEEEPEGLSGFAIR
jgi:acylphosphatase